MDRIHEYWKCFGGVHMSPWEVELEYNRLREDSLRWSPWESIGGGDLHIRFVSSVGAHGRWVSWWSLVFRTSRKGTLNTTITRSVFLTNILCLHL